MRTFLCPPAFFAILLLLLGACRRTPSFPSDRTPEGAYARVTLALYDGQPETIFPYLEDEAQWSAHTIAKERRAAKAIVDERFPAEARADALAMLGADGNAADGAAVFVRIARERGWLLRLQKDLTGLARQEVDGDRAVLVTVRGTRYPLRRRAVGIWGLTLFTAELTAEAERATRDRARIEAAAADWAQARTPH